MRSCLLFRPLLTVVAVAAVACSSGEGGGTDSGEGALPPPGQAEVTGTVTAASAEDAVAPSLATPLSIVVERGAGNVTIEGALVDGDRSAIVWDGGRPLMLEGDGGLDLGPAGVIVDGTGTATWQLDGAVRVLLPGGYRIGAPVAVGQGGLAETRSGVAFDADDQTRVESRGGATAMVGPGALRLEGPGSVVLEGRFSVVTTDATRDATRLVFGPGPFVVELRPEADGLAVTATLNGPLEVE